MSEIDPHLTEEQILDIARRVGNKINGLEGMALIDPDQHSLIVNDASLLVGEALDPDLQNVQRTLPEGIDG